MMYALDREGFWHSAAVTYPAQARTSCCQKKLECVMFVTNLELEAGQQKCPDLIDKQKRGQQFIAFRNR